MKISTAFIAGLATLATLTKAVDSDNYEEDPTLATPTVARILNNEFESIVEFSPGQRSAKPEDDLPPRVESYLIEFGPVQQNFPNSIRQIRPVGQMQLLDEGVLNKGRIFFLGKSQDGTKMVRSPSSGNFFFQSTSEQVNEIRKQAVWFDDFNGDAGDHDERRWNVATTVCSDSVTANFPVNNQKHVHTQVGAFDPRCSEDQMTARARGVFEFGNGGKVFVDHDGGAFPGHEFFLEVAEEGASDLSFSAGEKNVMRIALDNSQLDVFQVRSDGSTRKLTRTVDLFARADETYSVANVRRPWVLEMDQRQMSLTINGQKVLNNVRMAEPLPFTRGNVRLTHRNKNSLRNGQFAVTMHLDNIGFDGINPEFQTLNYRNERQKAFRAPRLNRPFTIEVEESATDNVGPARLRFTKNFQGFRQNEQVFVNGQRFFAQLPQNRDRRNAFQPVTYEVEIPSNLVAGRNNQIAFSPNNGGFVGNVHIEMDFACTGAARDARTYTVPNSQPIFASSFPISFNCDVNRCARPVLELKAINGRQPVASSLNVQNGVATGTVTVDMFTDRQLRHNGGSQGLSELQALVDCEVQNTVSLGDGLFQVRDFPIDVEVRGRSQSTQLWLQAVDKQGRTSTLGAQTPISQRGSEGEQYLPLFVNPQGGRLGAEGRVVRNPRCPTGSRRTPFVGCDCGDTAEFTRGIQALSVCDAVPTENTEFIRAANAPVAVRGGNRGGGNRGGGNRRGGNRRGGNRRTRRTRGNRRTRRTRGLISTRGRGQPRRGRSEDIAGEMPLSRAEMTEDYKMIDYGYFGSWFQLEDYSDVTDPMIGKDDQMWKDPNVAPMNTTECPELTSYGRHVCLGKQLMQTCPPQSYGTSKDMASKSWVMREVVHDWEPEDMETDKVDTYLSQMDS